LTGWRWKELPEGFSKPAFITYFRLAQANTAPPEDKKHKAGKSHQQFAEVVANRTHQGVDQVA
jgi:hypothetical protein